MHLPGSAPRGLLQRVLLLSIAAIVLAVIKPGAASAQKPDALTIVAVGDLKTIEAPVRALNLGTVEVWDNDGNKIR